MRIWVDGDAAPREVKEVVFRAAERLDCETLFVANAPLTIPRSCRQVRSILVNGVADAADDYIVAHSQAGDLAITADIPLAARLVEADICVIDPRGEHFDPEKIASRLAMRDFLDRLRAVGIHTGNAPPYSDRDKRCFAATLDRMLTRLSRAI
jgi:uncharacterized protein YaiI (UPF0178 family)